MSILPSPRTCMSNHSMFYPIISCNSTHRTDTVSSCMYHGNGGTLNISSGMALHTRGRIHQMVSWQHSVQPVPSLGRISLICGCMIPISQSCLSHPTLFRLMTHLVQIRFVYTRTIVMDGNFSADHMKMRCPEADVGLSNGMGFMVEDHRYKEHLKQAQESTGVRISVFISIIC